MAICWLASRTNEIKGRKNEVHWSRLTLSIVLEMSYVILVVGRIRCIEGLQNVGQGQAVPRMCPSLKPLELRK